MFKASFNDTIDVTYINLRSTYTNKNKANRYILISYNN